MPSRSESEVGELIGKYAEEITSLWKTLGPVERGWVDLPDAQVEALRRRMSECEAELERLKLELPEAPQLRRS
jgi:hypothetical protein